MAFSRNEKHVHKFLYYGIDRHNILDLTVFASRSSRDHPDIFGYSYHKIFFNRNFKIREKNKIPFPNILE